MVRPNESVAELLQEYSDLIAITSEDAIKARAYEKAARAVAGHHADLSELDRGELRRIPNVGGSIADKIVEFLRSGRVEAVEQLRSQVPAGVRELTTIPTLGPKKAMLLHRELGVSSAAELAHAVDVGQLAGLRGFGPKAIENIRHGIELLRQDRRRVLVSVAEAVAEEMVAKLSSSGAVRCGYAGSLRRMQETVGDVDLLAAAADPRPVMEAFVRLPTVTEVLAHGPTKSSVRTDRGLQVDLRVVRPEVWGAALLYFTGSKPHNIRLREIAIRRGLKLSEYGLFRLGDGKLVVSETEPEVYHHLGLPWIPPPLREDRGEIEAALLGELPALLKIEEIRGDLHTHTDLTDGVSSLAEMVAAARARGYSYYAVTDHGKDLPMQRMTDDKMLAQRAKLRELAGEGRMTLLHGSELNIGPDGGVDWDDEFLAGFDLRVASVHSQLNQPREQLTRRLVRACEHRYVNIIGHPTTRLIGRRAPIDVDFDEVFRAAARTGTAMEINSYPDRLDLTDELIRQARQHGVRFAVDTDAHAVGHLDYLRYGVGTAQRGWLSADEVINTWPVAKLRRFVRDKARIRPRS